MNKDLSPQQMYELIELYCFNNGVTVREFAKQAKVAHMTLEHWRLGNTKKAHIPTMYRIRKTMEGNKND